MVNITLRKKIALTPSTIIVAIMLVVLVAYPAFAADPDLKSSSVLKIKIDAKSYAFSRIDEETLEQHKSAISILIQLHPTTENTELKIDIDGTVTVGDKTYMVTNIYILTVWALMKMGIRSL